MNSLEFINKEIEVKKMKKFLYKLMEYKFIYKLMPKWTKFMYCFEIMINNQRGRLHLDNGYALNFETMTIDTVIEHLQNKELLEVKE